MSKSPLTGNETIGLGAVRAGAKMVSGYPGAPSMEALETMTKHNPGDIYIEWSVNEKTGMKVAAVAAYIGARTMVAMEQVGLNMASDPLMSLAYVGVKGGMMVMAVDDPGPVSSQTEQDIRRFDQFSKLPVSDPSSPEEAYEAVKDVFEYSEEHRTPVLFRPIARLCHGYASVEFKERVKLPAPKGFVKDSGRWVIFPRLSHVSHRMVEVRNPIIGRSSSSYRFNLLHREERSTVKGIVTHGISYGFITEAPNGYRGARVLRVSVPNPMPEHLLLEFTEGLDQAMAVEELDSVLERELLLLSGRYCLSLEIKSELTGGAQTAGENFVGSVKRVLEAYLGEAYIRYLEGLEGGATEPEATLLVPPLSVRPPVPCAGCPHQASFYVVKRVMERLDEGLGEDVMPIEGVCCGDIGYYTLGNVKPLDMVDTCLCMGAGITTAQGLQQVEPDKRYFSFVGGSTLSASGLTGIVNTVYNEASLTPCILDNPTTAMTGHQPHPGIGRTMMGNIVKRIDITKVLEGIGVKNTVIAGALNLDVCVGVVLKLSAMRGVKAIIFKSPCAAIIKSFRTCRIVEDRCVNRRTYINEIDCPALVLGGDIAGIDSDLCTGCDLCSQICLADVIETVK